MERARIRNAERQLLEETLHGSIKALTGVLGLANPTAFGWAMRLKRYVSDVAQRLGIEERWHIEVTAMLSQVGCVNMPPETRDRLCRGRTLSPDQPKVMDHLPEMARVLVANIPRLEPVSQVLAHQRVTGSRPSASANPSPDRMPRDAQLLRIALEFDRQGEEEEFLPIDQLVLGMVLAQDVVRSRDRLLIARGHEITESVLRSLQCFSKRAELAGPIRVLRVTSARERRAS